LVVGLSYTFSGVTVHPKTWTPVLTEIKERVEFEVGRKFNFVLVNRYKNGQQHIGEHRDDEKDLLPDSPIASVSFGQEREFVFRHEDLHCYEQSHKQVLVPFTTSQENSNKTQDKPNFQTNASL
jgi:alkylated DNA repair dioxygenase AlkB